MRPNRLLPFIRSVKLSWNGTNFPKRSIATTSHSQNVPQSETCKQLREFDRVIFDADRLVNNCSRNLTQLIDDEIMIVSHMLQKLIGAKSSLTEINNLCHEGSSNENYIRGIISLLTSKMAQQHKSTIGRSEQSDEITNSQWIIAKTSEMIHMAVLIHNKIRNVAQDLHTSNEDDSKTNLKNKISILYGDFLWARAWRELSDLTDLYVIEMIVTVLLNTSMGLFMSEVEMIDVETKVNLDYWLEKNFMLSACLPAFACKSTIKLSTLNEQMQNYGYEFGKNFGYVIKAYNEIQWFNNESVDTNELVDFCSLPVIMHSIETGKTLTHLCPDKSELQQLKPGDKKPTYDFHQLHTIVRNGPGLVKSKAFLDNFRAAACQNLFHFSNSDSKEQLEKVISAMNVKLV